MNKQNLERDRVIRIMGEDTRTPEQKKEDRKKAIEKRKVTLEHPIIFDSHSVLAILNTNPDHSAIDPSKPIKWQTRRVIKSTNPSLPLPQEVEPWIVDGEWEADHRGTPMWQGSHPNYPTGFRWFTCYYGKAGDRLWVRETWSNVPRTAYSQSPGVWQTPKPGDSHDTAVYKAGWERSEPSWRSPMLMPRWGSRITLKLTGVRVERLQNISYSDILAEGLAVYEGTQLVKPDSCLDQAIYRDQWIRRWDSINKKRGYSWEINPWVWVLEFHRILSN